MKKELSEKEKLIKGWKNRIQHHQKQLKNTIAFNRGEESKLVKKIKLEQMQLRALIKVK